MEPTILTLDQPLFILGSYTVTLGMCLFGTAAIVLFAGIPAVLRRRRDRQSADDAEQRMTALLAAQTEMQGRIAAMADVFGARQSELNQSISQRIDGMTHRLGTSITEQTKATH